MHTHRPAGVVVIYVFVLVTFGCLVARRALEGRAGLDVWMGRIRWWCMAIAIAAGSAATIGYLWWLWTL